MPRFWRALRFSMGNVVHPEAEHTDVIVKQEAQLEQLQALLAQWSTKLTEFSAASTALHAHLSEVYPPNGTIAGNLRAVSGSTEGTSALAAQLPMMNAFIARMSDSVSAEVQAPLHTLSAHLRERATLEREVAHYDGKVARLHMRSQNGEHVRVNETKLQAARSAHARIADACAAQLAALNGVLDARLSPLIELLLSAEAALLSDAGTFLRTTVHPSASSEHDAQLPAIIAKFEQLQAARASQTFTPQPPAPSSTASAPAGNTSTFTPAHMQPITPHSMMTGTRNEPDDGFMRAIMTPAPPVTMMSAIGVVSTAQSSDYVQESEQQQCVVPTTSEGISVPPVVPAVAPTTAAAAHSSAVTPSLQLLQTVPPFSLARLGAALSDGASMNLIAGDLVTLLHDASPSPDAVAIMTRDGPAVCPPNFLRMLPGATNSVHTSGVAHDDALYTRSHEAGVAVVDCSLITTNAEPDAILPAGTRVECIIAQPAHGGDAAAASASDAGVVVHRHGYVLVASSSGVCGWLPTQAFEFTRTAAARRGTIAR